MTYDTAPPFLDLPSAQNCGYVGSVHQRHYGPGRVIERGDVERRRIEQDDVGLLAGGQRAGLRIDFQPLGAADGGESQRIPTRT